ncbi:hypothetical protein [Dyella psychrodurans]|uniref:Haem-binding uptake Tiki superfamily ChaN domain-containing protein n=1 Tax=Dyella psychrodurans TaxID=1927960 RepID=A0A370XBB2_9GAMM|nr:hypothetical protein [Dyella psychrodurans]RDS85551.1 hypothetical protein DWU99_08590 [Dyella psychrodurans]
MPMRIPIVMCLFCTTVLLASTSLRAQTSAPSTRQLLTHFGTAPNGLARYDYLTSVMPLFDKDKDKDNKMLAQQLLATVDSELGLYNEAMMAFPFDNRVALPKSTLLPRAENWHSVDAADAVVELASQHRIVMINESHHDAHTRELTLALLPRLRALGFRYFAAEALGDKDADLMRRGYVIDTSGSEYLLEPLYGEIIRQAIKLGYIIVPYDSDASPEEDRDTVQAHTLYEKVFAKDPQAKLFVHAGYSHIDKAAGNLGDNIQPMAKQLKQLTGEDPLCVDQVQFRDVAVGGIDFGYYAAVALRFPSDVPIALRDRGSPAYWSSDPRMHDITVILPPASPQDLDVTGSMTSDQLRRIIILPRPPFNLDVRPYWLSLSGRRITYKIDTDLCTGQVPCVVDAYYPDEPDNAVPADRYTFVKAHAHNVLYLYPGHYRLRAWNAEGKTLSQLQIDVPTH